jgi:hypothetical protein
VLEQALSWSYNLASLESEQASSRLGTGALLKLNLGPSGPETDCDENRKFSTNEGDAFDPE